MELWVCVKVRDAEANVACGAGGGVRQKNLRVRRRFRNEGARSDFKGQELNGVLQKPQNTFRWLTSDNLISSANEC